MRDLRWGKVTGWVQIAKTVGTNITTLYLTISTARTNHMRTSGLLVHTFNTQSILLFPVWEGRNPRGIRMLLSDPRWESRLLRFLELSGVGRCVEGGVDEDQAHAEKMDGWIVWEAEEEGARRSPGR